GFARDSSASASASGSRVAGASFVGSTAGGPALPLDTRSSSPSGGSFAGATRACAEPDPPLGGPLAGSVPPHAPASPASPASPATPATPATSDASARQRRCG